MNYTKVQISELMRKHAQKENVLHDLLEIMLESMMVAERSEFLSENQGNKGNGYRPGHTYGHGRRLEFRIPLQRCVTHLKRNMLAKVRHGDKAEMAADLRDIFRTGQPDYTVEMAWAKWQKMCDRWGKEYRAIKLLRNSEDYKFYMTYLNYAPQIQSSINMYHTSIERFNRDFRRVIKMRTAMPNEEAVITLIGSVAMEHKSFDRQLPNITADKSLFPD